MKRHLKSSLSRMLLLVCTGLCGTALADYFYNPIQNGADPSCIFTNGYYYYMQTDGGIHIRRAQYLANPVFGLPNDGYATVFNPPAPNNQNIWAPELHYINGNWYIYYTAGTLNDPNDVSHRIFCLQANSQDPLGSYTLMGKVYDPNADFWAIDPTVFQKSDGSLYCVYCSRASSSNDGVSRIYIAPMSNPWTISGSRVLIASPVYSWEANVNEAPQIIQNAGKIFLIYSANNSGTDNYCLGQLVNTDGNVLNAGSWTKSSSPVFASYSGSDGAVYAPGSCTFVKSRDGTQDWIIYHAAVSQGSGFNRNVRTQQFSWNSDGSPNFGHPIPVGDPITVPSGEGCNNSAPVSVVVATNGANYVYAVGTDGAVWTTWQTNFGASWSPLMSLGGNSLAHVHVVMEPAGPYGGQQVAFAQENPGGAVFTKWQTDTTNNVWSGPGWAYLGQGIVTFEPVMLPAGNVALYAIGTDGGLWTSWQTNYGGTWFPWTYMGGRELGLTRLHTVMQSDGSTAIFCLDKNGNVQTMWQNSYAGPWFGFANLGGGLITFEPTISAAGICALYGPSLSGGAMMTLWQTVKGGSWNGWASLGGAGFDTVRVVEGPDGATAVFGTAGPGGHVFCTWQTTWAGNWNSWIDLGGPISDFKPAAYPNNTMSVFAISYDALVTAWQTNAGSSTWFGWPSLGSTFMAQ